VHFAFFIPLRFSENLIKKAGAKCEFYTASQIFSEILREIKSAKPASGFLSIRGVAGMVTTPSDDVTVLAHLPVGVNTKKSPYRQPFLSAKRCAASGSE